MPCILRLFFEAWKSVVLDKQKLIVNRNEYDLWIQLNSCKNVLILTLKIDLLGWQLIFCRFFWQLNTKNGVNLVAKILIGSLKDDKVNKEYQCSIVS